MEPFKNMLVVVDGSAPTINLKRTIEFAAHHDSRVKLVSVVRPYTWLERVAAARFSQFREQLVEEYGKRLDELAAECRAAGVEATTRVLVGKASPAIIREVIRDGHDLVVKEAKGTSWYKGFFGATAIQLLRKCPCAVWLTKPGPHATYERVMAAVCAGSFDEAHTSLNHTILELAKSFCEWEKSRLYLVEAWAVYGEDILRNHMRKDEFEELIKSGHDNAERLFDTLLRDHGFTCQSEEARLLHGDPSLILPQFADHENIDLIVMGTIARAGVAGALLGNTAETLLSRVQCSILAVKPTEFISPVTLET